MNQATPQQQRAIAARGNVVVSAGAGTGKTKTLIERCLAWILGPEEGSVDQLLMVTFTEAAATEMRHRLRLGLEAAYDAEPSLRLQEQLALLETAHISTLHSFCFHLVSQHFYELRSDPPLDGPINVLSAERARLLASDAMTDVLNKIYDGKSPRALAVQEFIKAQGGDWDKPTRQIVHRLHEYRHSLRDPDGWLAQQRDYFSQERSEWSEWIMRDLLPTWSSDCLNFLNRVADGNIVAAKCAGVLSALPIKPSRADYANALRGLLHVEVPRGAAPLRKAIENVFADAEYLLSVTEVEEADPLQEDWNWTRPSMLALLDLTEAFGRAYSRAKRAAGGVDFQDLEQFALRLLWRDGQRTLTAEQWQKKFRLIFVDEFQDINDAQDEIIRALSRDGGEANRFLVGDVKQSIYRFRLANPAIFKHRQKEWQTHGGALELTENFRSHERVIDFVNSIFTALMPVEYDARNRLVFGDRANRAAAIAAQTPVARVELHLRMSDKEQDDEAMEDVEREARMAALRLQELKRSGAIIQAPEGPRPIRWNDMALLIRSPRGRVESYVKAFTNLGIPLVAARSGFYDTMEARDLLNLLVILDNPLQDIPLLGVLASPFAGFSPRDLALIRIGREKGSFWEALTAFHEASEANADLKLKTALFLERFYEWRRQARQNGVSTTLETALDQTNYTAWLGAQDRAAQRRANVERFLQLTRDFDAERGEGLHRFLALVQAQQDSEVDIEPASPVATDAVRLMSIHQSKGLEFPVVAVCDLAKKFNFRDSTGRIIIDEEFGLCPQIKAPGSGQFYPSLPHWLAHHRQRQETLNEELRLLYVALTRAREWLILAGTVSDKTIEEKWPKLAEALATPEGVGKCHSYLDWIGGWWSAQENFAAAGNPIIFYHRGEESPEQRPAGESVEEKDISTDVISRLDWNYRFSAATKQPAKTSVSALRRQSAQDEESTVWLGQRSRNSGLGASEIGSAHHLFLEFANLEKVAEPQGIAEEVTRLQRVNKLSQEQAASLDVAGLLSFWQSEVGRGLLARKEYLRRELNFTARLERPFLPADIQSPLDKNLWADEYIIVQGAVDLAAIMPREIWLVDFKTDNFAPGDLDKKVAQYESQLALYIIALTSIYRRPVTRSWFAFLRQRQIVLHGFDFRQCHQGAPH